MINFKPMLSIDATNSLDKLKYPKLASYKLDGIRCVFHPDLGMVSRSLKPIQNTQIRRKFHELVNYSQKHDLIFDGELYAHKMTFQQMISAVMTKNTHLNVKNIKFHVFECCSNKISKTSFIKRHALINKLLGNEKDLVTIVKQMEVNSKEEVTQLFKTALDNGYEGLILRDPKSPYKFGRSTLREEYMLKIKPFRTFDSYIIGVEERMENLNESFCNELGHSEKRNTVDAKGHTGIAAKFIVKYGDKEVKPTITGTEEFRREMWENRKSYIGRMIEYKGMVVGSKHVPRHPVFLRFRDDRPIKKPIVKNADLSKWM